MRSSQNTFLSSNKRQLTILESQALLCKSTLVHPTIIMNNIFFRRATSKLAAARVFRAFPKAAMSTKAAAVATPVASGKADVVVLGSGWAGFNTAINVKPDVPLTVVSPLNHFLFTPLLASSSVGTLEFRCIQEPIRTVLSSNGKYVQATAKSLDPDNKSWCAKRNLEMSLIWSTKSSLLRSESRPT